MTNNFPSNAYNSKKGKNELNKERSTSNSRKTTFVPSISKIEKSNLENKSLNKENFNSKRKTMSVVTQPKKEIKLDNSNNIKTINSIIENEFKNEINPHVDNNIPELTNIEENNKNEIINNPTETQNYSKNKRKFKDFINEEENLNLPQYSNLENLTELIDNIHMELFRINSESNQLNSDRITQLKNYFQSAFNTHIEISSSAPFLLRSYSPLGSKILSIEKFWINLIKLTAENYLSNSINSKVANVEINMKNDNNAEIMEHIISLFNQAFNYITEESLVKCFYLKLMREIEEKTSIVGKFLEKVNKSNMNNNSKSHDYNHNNILTNEILFNLLDPYVRFFVRTNKEKEERGKNGINIVSKNSSEKKIKLREDSNHLGNSKNNNNNKINFNESQLKIQNNDNFNFCKNNLFNTPILNSKRESVNSNNPVTHIEDPTNNLKNSNLKKESLAIQIKIEEDSSEKKDNIAPLNSLTQMTENMIISQRTHERQLEFMLNLNNNNQINLSLMSQISMASVKEVNEVHDVSNLDNYVNFTVNEEVVANETNEINNDLTSDISNQFNKEKIGKMFKLDNQNVEFLVAGQGVLDDQLLSNNLEEKDISKNENFDELSKGKLEDDEILDVIEELECNRSNCDCNQSKSKETLNFNSNSNFMNLTDLEEANNFSNNLNNLNSNLACRASINFSESKQSVKSTRFMKTVSKSRYTSKSRSRSKSQSRRKTLIRSQSVDEEYPNDLVLGSIKTFNKTFMGESSERKENNEDNRED